MIASIILLDIFASTVLMERLEMRSTSNATVWFIVIIRHVHVLSKDAYYIFMKVMKCSTANAQF